MKNLPPTKVCADCGETKDRSEFYSRKHHKTEVRYPEARCKLCARARRSHGGYRPKHDEVPEGSCLRCRGVIAEDDLVLGPDGEPKPVCGPCLDTKAEVWRRSTLWRSFRITPEQYDEMLEEQGGVCAICERAETTFDQRQGKYRRLAVDHDRSCCPGDQSCGECVRGLLCAACNKALGLFQDKVAALTRAIAYLSNG